MAQTLSPILAAHVRASRYAQRERPAAFAPDPNQRPPHGGGRASPRCDVALPLIALLFAPGGRPS